MNPRRLSVHTITGEIHPRVRPNLRRDINRCKSRLQTRLRLPCRRTKTSAFTERTDQNKCRARPEHDSLEIGSAWRKTYYSPRPDRMCEAKGGRKSTTAGHHRSLGTVEGFDTLRRLLSDVGHRANFPA